MSKDSLFGSATFVLMWLAVVYAYVNFYGNDAALIDDKVCAVVIVSVIMLGTSLAAFVYRVVRGI